VVVPYTVLAVVVMAVQLIQLLSIDQLHRVVVLECTDKVMVELLMLYWQQVGQVQQAIRLKVVKAAEADKEIVPQTQRVVTEAQAVSVVAVVAAEPQEMEPVVPAMVAQVDRVKFGS
jgi:hypothetical protein